jgi:GxxExxY protein
MTVHKELGCGFLEAVYKEALGIEMKENDIPFVMEQPLDIYYKDILLTKKYFADVICFDKIILELKSTDNLVNQHYAQMLNYLNATKYRLGLLINFGQESLQYKRVIL